MEAFLPVGILFILALVLCFGIFAVTNLLGPRIRGKVKLAPYECGVQSFQGIEGERFPFQFRFYLIAVIFLLFDVEGAFFLPWALIYRESLQTGPELLIAMLIFSFFVALGLIYVLKKGYLHQR